MSGALVYVIGLLVLLGLVYSVAQGSERDRRRRRPNHGRRGRGNRRGRRRSRYDDYDDYDDYDYDDYDDYDRRGGGYYRRRKDDYTPMFIGLMLLILVGFGISWYNQGSKAVRTEPAKIDLPRDNQTTNPAEQTYTEDQYDIDHDPSNTHTQEDLSKSGYYEDVGTNSTR